MDATYAARYGEIERNHWWFRARRVILRSQMRKHVGWQLGMEVLEVGVGPGENLYSLYPDDVSLQGLEPEEHNATFANSRGEAPVYQGVLEKLPEPLAAKRYDVITLFDVLEHIEDDDAALDRLHTLLKPGGKLVLSVPAYMFLWGRQDVVNHHFRRYTGKELSGKLRAHGFKLVRRTYFNSLLFPPIALVRLLKRGSIEREAGAKQSDFDYQAGPVSALLFRLFRFEAFLLKFLSFPFGVSWFCVAEKPAE